MVGSSSAKKYYPTNYGSEATALNVSVGRTCSSGNIRLWFESFRQKSRQKLIRILSDYPISGQTNEVASLVYLLTYLSAHYSCWRRALGRQTYRI